MKIGARVTVRPTAPSMRTNKAAMVVDARPKVNLYKLRFRDGAEMWFLRKEIIRA